MVRHNFELPAFSTLVRMVNSIKVAVYDNFYDSIYNSFDENTCNVIDKLFDLDTEKSYTEWNYIKKEPGKPSLTNLKEALKHIIWLSEKNVGAFVLKEIPDIKIKQFANEARTLDAARMKEMEPKKRYTLTVSLIFLQSASAIDDLAEMFIKKMMSINKNAKQELEKQQLESIKNQMN